MFASTQSLPFAGFQGEVVPHQFLRQADASDHLAVLLPGMGYTCDMPLFYYAQNLLEDRGADLLRVEYAYGKRPEFRMLSAPEQARWLFGDVAAACRAGCDQGDYRRVTLVGKSLGTLAMGQLPMTGSMAHAIVRRVWLTPALGDATLREQMKRHRKRSLIAIGAEDPGYDAAFLAEFAASGGTTIVVPGAEHGLDIVGDVAGSIAAVGRVVQALEQFLDT